HRPRSPPFLVGRLEEDGEASLRIAPGVLEDVPAHQHPARVLQLEQVLHCPMDAAVAWIANAPRERLEEVVVAYLDVRGDQFRDRWVGAAEHHVLARPVELIVRDLERPGTVPSAD